MLSVLNVAFPFAAVDCDPVGGAEQVVAALDRALSAAGHRSVLVARAASRASGRLVPVDVPAGAIDANARAATIAGYRQALARALSAGDIDVIHLHGSDFFEYLPDVAVPRLVTLHLPLAWYPRAALAPVAGVRKICVSRSQRDSAGLVGLAADAAARLGLVENGVPLDRYRPLPDKRDYALMLGRICPEKGFDAAIRAARRAGARLLMAGELFGYAEHERYLREQVIPLLDAERQLIGPVKGDVKRELLARARCVLVPSRADETSSLVAMEALACGTPVIAFRRGALPEIVEQGRTGFIVEDEAQMAAAIDFAGRLRPEDCRAAAEARFSAGAMTQRYFELYQRAAREKRRASRRSSPPRLSVHEIGDDASLASVAPEWSDLCAASGAPTPFQRPEWLLAARRHLSPRATPHALAVRRGSRLVGLLPLEREGDWLRWTGAGVSDYLDLVCEPGSEAAVAGAVLAHLAAARCSWRVVELDALPPDSPLVGCALPRGLRGALVQRAPTPVARLPLADTPRKLSYYRRRLSREGCVRWRMASEASAVDLLGVLIALHTRRWSALGQAGVLCDPAVQRFHIEAAPAMARRGLLRLHVLELDGAAIAALYGFAERGRFLFYLSGFAPELARLSPGVLAIDHAICAAEAEGEREFDFLRGREGYKYAWGAVDRPTFLRRIWHG